MGEAARERFEVERVDWLDSGGRSGLLRVHGRRSAPGPLPDLVIPTPAGEERHTSLPDPRAETDPRTWRGAYVVHGYVVSAAGDRMELEFPSGSRVPLPAPRIGRPAAPTPPPPPAREEPGGEVVDRAVLAERRARRAEAAEQAQARIAREALRAVEILESRTAELEQRLEVARAGSDGAPAVRSAPDDGEAERLRARLAQLERELAAARRGMAAVRAQPGAGEAAEPEDRQVERLRSALSSAIVTIGDLRLALHEARLRRRVSDVEHGADGVRLAVLASERTDLEAQLTALRERAALAAARETQLRREAELAQARAAAAEKDHAETRRRLAERTAELARERDRTAAVEAELADARERLERLGDELETARTARELAEASLAAAVTERQAAEVAWAALADEMATAEETAVRLPEPAAQSGRPDAAPDEPAAGFEPPDEPVAAYEPPDERVAAPEPEERPATSLLDDIERRTASAAANPDQLAELARSLKPVPPEPGTAERLMADLDAARAALLADPGRLETGPRPLRRALVALAREDAAGAARVLTGLLPAQWRAVPGPLEYDLTIAGAGTFAVSVGEGGCTVAPVARARRRRRAAFHLSADALALAEILTGSGPRPGRFGRVRLKGRRRRFRSLEPLATTSVSLEDAARAGASLEPAEALRCLAYAVDPAWTRGWSFTVVQTFTDPDETVHLTARDGDGLDFGAGEPEGEPDATVTMSRAAFAAMLRGEAPTDRPTVRGDHRAVEMLRIWADRLRRGDGVHGP